MSITIWIFTMFGQKNENPAHSLAFVILTKPPRLFRIKPAKSRKRLQSFYITEQERMPMIRAVLFDVGGTLH